MGGIGLRFAMRRLARIENYRSLMTNIRFRQALWLGLAGLIVLMLVAPWVEFVQFSWLSG